MSSSKARQNKRKQNPHEERRVSSYQNISFDERPSSGRPGSPHRYFDNSYNVIFSESDGNGDSDGDVGRHLDGQVQEETCSSLLSNTTPALQSNFEPDNASKSTTVHRSLSGNQVVHRHLNGLCIVTAGDMLKETILQSTINNEQHNGQAEKEAGNVEVGISSIQYLVKVGKDSQSARGKMRTKNKKQKRRKDSQSEQSKKGGDADPDSHDGNVMPHDPLCRITFTDGKEIELKCCVVGTVIELNRQLMELEESVPVNTDDGTKLDKGEDVGNPSLASLLLKDPLLDGHLAVIMPTRGAFPPKDRS